MQFQFCTPTLFGLEGIVKDECKHLGFSNPIAETGRVYFSGDEHTLARANLALRCAERVLLLLKKFPAYSFEDLFQGALAVPWESYLPSTAAFPVKGFSLDSQLHSVPDCQSVLKKAIVSRLQRHYKQSWFNEEGPVYPIQFALRDNQCELYLDTTGIGLHKRGYRPASNAAPLRETLAAALVLQSRYRGRETFIDPMCGSGTILIEAGMIARNQAPGIRRSFTFEKWSFLPSSVCEAEKDYLRSKEYHGEYSILGRDRDPKAIQLSKDNVRRAGLSSMIHVQSGDLQQLSLEDTSVLMVTNPPYGERMGDLRYAEDIIKILGALHQRNPNWKMGIISPHPHFETLFGVRAQKRRKLYNGMIQCQFYYYF